MKNSKEKFLLRTQFQAFWQRISKEKPYYHNSKKKMYQKAIKLAAFSMKTLKITKEKLREDSRGLYYQRNPL